MRKLLLIVAVVLSVAILWVLLNEHAQINSTGSLAVAEKTWGDVCGNLEPQIKTEDLSGRKSGKAVLKWIELPGGGRQYTTCEILIDPATRRRGRTYCAILVHEYGHLAGEDHSPNPDSVMYFKITRRNIPRDC